MKLFSFGLLITLCAFKIYGQPQDTTKQGTTFNKPVYIATLINGTQITNRFGLDSIQFHELVTLMNTNIRLSEEILRLSEKMLEDRDFVDSLMRVTLIRHTKQTRIDELERINDSIMSSIDADSIIYSKLERMYDYMLKDEMADFWQQNPDFNPSNDAELVAFLEKTKKTKFRNIINSDCHNLIDSYRKDNAKVRDSPECWTGISMGNIFYYFQGEGFNPYGTIRSYTEANIGKMSFSLPNVGKLTVFDLREHYSNYHQLLSKKERILEQQYNRFKANPELPFDQIINPK